MAKEQNEFLALVQKTRVLADSLIAWLENFVMLRKRAMTSPHRLESLEQRVRLRHNSFWLNWDRFDRLGARSRCQTPDRYKVDICLLHKVLLRATISLVNPVPAV